MREVMSMRGELATDGDTIYVNGMDLAEVIRACFPDGVTKDAYARSQGGEYRVTIERLGDA